MTAQSPCRRHCQRGALMIEILATLAVMATGVLGTLDLHTRLQMSELEAYQRTQAIMLLDDMIGRLTSNGSRADGYVTDAVAGVGAVDCADPDNTSDLAGRDLAQWCLALQGAAEIADDQPVGTLLMGRGCIQALADSAAGGYLVTVVWQGASPLSPPPQAITCGRQGYDQPVGSACERRAEACRRYVSAIVHIADLGEA